MSLCLLAHYVIGHRHIAADSREVLEADQAQASVDNLPDSHEQGLGKRTMPDERERTKPRQVSVPSASATSGYVGVSPVAPGSGGTDPAPIHVAAASMDLRAAFLESRGDEVGAQKARQSRRALTAFLPGQVDAN